MNQNSIIQDQEVRDMWKLHIQVAATLSRMASRALRDSANGQNRILDDLVVDILDGNKVRDPYSSETDVA